MRSRALFTAVAVVTAAFTLTACGDESSSPPSVKSVEADVKDAKYSTYRVALPDGRTVTCVERSFPTASGYTSVAIDCDWNGATKI